MTVDTGALVAQIIEQAEEHDLLMIGPWTPEYVDALSGKSIEKVKEFIREANASGALAELPEWLVANI